MSPLPSTTELAPGLLVVAGVLGLAVGSFLNVVIHRLPLGLSLSHPGSRCPSCETPIKARHNVPVFGWLVLRGRCHTCRAPIAVRYPLVEAGTAVAFVAVTGALLAGSDDHDISSLAPVPAWLWLTATLIAAVLIEQDGHRAPVRFAVLTAVVVAALLLVAHGAAGAAGAWWPLVRAALGALVVGGVAGVVPTLRRERSEAIGFGVAAALALGALSWVAVIVGGAGCLVGAFVARRPSRPALFTLALAAAIGLVVASVLGY